MEVVGLWRHPVKSLQGERLEVADLEGHGVVGGVGVLSIQFHPRQPWILSAGVDGLINLYQDI